MGFLLNLISQENHLDVFWWWYQGILNRDSILGISIFRFATINEIRLTDWYYRGLENYTYGYPSPQ